MYDCGFYSANNRCGNKDFLGLFYWSIGLPVLSILALGGKRVFHIFGMVVWVVLVIVLVLGQCHTRVFLGRCQAPVLTCLDIITVQGSPALMYRNFINCELCSRVCIALSSSSPCSGLSFYSHPIPHVPPFDQLSQGEIGQTVVLPSHPAQVAVQVSLPFSLLFKRLDATDG